MSYTPINWQTGDTITAEKMNKMDNGWGVSSTQLFSETVTTETDVDYAYGILAYTGTSTPATLIITLNGVDYTCTAFVDGRDYIYGDPDLTWAEYPFQVYFSMVDHEWTLYTPSSGTYAISASASGVSTSADFGNAVKSVVDADSIPLKCVSGATTRAEMETAQSKGRLMYFMTDSYFIITNVTNGITFIPDQAGLHAEFDESDLFYVYYS